MGYGCMLVAFAILCMNGKALMEGAATFLTEKKKVDCEERRKDQEFQEAAQRRRDRQTKLTSTSSRKALKAPEDEPLLLPAPVAKPSRARVTAKRRS